MDAQFHHLESRVGQQFQPRGVHRVRPRGASGGADAPGVPVAPHQGETVRETIGSKGCECAAEEAELHRWGVCAAGLELALQAFQRLPEGSVSHSGLKMLGAEDATNGAA